VTFPRKQLQKSSTEVGRPVANQTATLSALGDLRAA
jgi:hypothetical protein